MEDVDWNIIVVGSLSHAGNIQSESIAKALNVLNSRGLSELTRDYSTSILIPFIELLKNPPNYFVLMELMNKNTIPGQWI